MTTIRLELKVTAPASRCFDLARSIDLHVDTQSRHGERAVEGKVSGLLGLGDVVTWEARHFFVRQRMSVKIIDFDFPRYFCDIMTRGAFEHFSHKHFFEAASDHVTIVRDECTFASPLGILGHLADQVAVKKHLRELLLDRNAVIKRTAESDGWRKYI